MKYRVNYDNLGIKLCLLSVLTVSLLFFPTATDLEATTTHFDNENEEEDESMTTITTIRAKHHLNTLDITNYDDTKVIDYINAEGEIAYLDLKEQNSEKLGIGPNLNLLIDLKSNNNSYISNLIVDDKYFFNISILDSKKLPDQINLPIYYPDGGRC